MNNTVCRLIQGFFLVGSFIFMNILLFFFPLDGAIYSLPIHREYRKVCR